MKILLFILFISSFLVNSQDLLKDFKHSKEMYKKHHAYSIQIVNRIYLEGNKTPLEEQMTKFDVDEFKFKKENNSELIVCDGTKKVIINKKKQAILLQTVLKNNDFKSENPVSNKSFSILDSLIKMAIKTQFVQFDESKVYKLYYKEGPFHQIDISFHNSGFIKYINYLLVDTDIDENGNEKRIKMQIYFQGLILSPNFRANYFSISPYVIKSEDKTYKTTSLYNKFRLVY